MKWSLRKGFGRKGGGGVLCKDQAAHTALGKMILGSPKFTVMVCIWTSPSAVVRFERGEPGTSTGFAPKLREFCEAL